MKIHALLFSVALLAGCSEPTEETTTPTADMAGTEMPPPAVTTAAAAPTASAVGVVEAVDPATGMITIAHDPVAALQWPAMTMAFKTHGVDLASIKAGDQVTFEFTAVGMDATITSIVRQ